MQYRFSVMLILGLVLVFFFGCVTPKSERNVVTSRAMKSAAPKTLAVLPFENNSVTDPKKYDPLSKGLAVMLITDLKKAGTSLELIERSKIEALLKEIALGQSGAIDQATAVRVGRILGAQSISFGAFMVLGPQVRIDSRIVKVETSEVIMAESIVGSKDDFLELERRLSQKIAASLRIALTPSTKQGSKKGELEAALLFSKGVEAFDNGDKEGAKRYFKQCVDLDSSYKVKIEELQKL